jgi:hypothetical protein
MCGRGENHPQIAQITQIHDMWSTTPANYQAARSGACPARFPGGAATRSRANPGRSRGEESRGYAACCGACYWHSNSGGNSPGSRESSGLSYVRSNLADCATGEPAGNLARNPTCDSAGSGPDYRSDNGEDSQANSGLDSPADSVRDYPQDEGLDDGPNNFADNSVGSPPGGGVELGASGLKSEATSR